MRADRLAVCGGPADADEGHLGFLVGNAQDGAQQTEKEWAEKARRFIKAELKRAGVTYAEVARRLEAHGLPETEASITSKLARGTFATRSSSRRWRLCRWKG